MLDTSAIVEVNVFFNLALLLAVGGLVDGHFHDFIWTGHDDRLQSRELGADVFVVYGPEAMET